MGRARRGEGPVRRLTIGRLQMYVEPRDVWVGLYVSPEALYVCPLPLCVIRWSRA
jgi:hypothetical protein